MSIKQYVFVLTPVLAILLAGCSRHSSSSAVGSVDLSNIPNASSMAAASSSSSAASNSMLKERALSLQSSGTPPTFLSIAESSSLIDSDIFGGVVTTINQAGSATSGANGTGAQFFGQVNGGPGGMPACQMLQGVAANMGNVLNNSNTTCYLQHIASTNTPGITVSGATQSTMFSQQASDTKLQMAISNMGNPGGTMDVDVVVAGTNTVGGDTYRVTLDFCNPGTDTPVQEEVITITKSTGLFTDNVVGNMGGGGNESASNLSAYLTGSGTGIVYDLTKDRIANYYYSFSQGGNSGTNQGKIAFHGNSTMESWQKNSFSQSGGSGTMQVYGDALIGGTSLSTLLISDAAINAIFSNTWSGQSFTNTFSANTAWTNTEYTAGSASSTVTSVVSAESIASDSFFTSAAPSTSVTSGFSCNSYTPTVTGTMDGNDSGVSGIQTTCDGEKLGESLWSMCQGGSGNLNIQQAQQYAQNQFHN